MTRQRQNFISGVLSSALAPGDVLMSSTRLADLDAVASPDIQVIVLDPLSAHGSPEIVHVVTHGALATTATIVRAREGTTARIHPLGTTWKHAPTVDDWRDIYLYAQQDYNAPIDGSSAVSALTALFADAQAGDTIYLEEGDYSVDNTVLFSNKKIRVIFAEGARLVQIADFNGPILKGDNVDGSLIVDPTIVGSETQASFLAWVTAEQAAGRSGASLRRGIELVNTSDARIERPYVTAKHYGVYLDTCTDTDVELPEVVGFLSSAVLGYNLHQAVEINQGSGNTVRGIRARNIGNGVVAGGSTNPYDIQVLGGVVRDYFNNGVYISSGNYCSVLQFTARSNLGTGSGVKTHGNGHLVELCEVIDGNIGITLSGNGAVADAYGANGYGSQALNNYVENMSSDGINIAATGGYFPRHCRIAKNVLVRTATGGSTFAAIRGVADYCEYDDNIIIECDGTEAAIRLVWTDPGGAGAPTVGTGLKVRRNSITDSASDAIRLFGLTDAIVEGNSGRVITGGDLIDARSVDNSTFRGNDGRGLTAVLRTDGSCDDNIAQDNKGTHVLGTTTNLVRYSGTGAPAVGCKAGSTYAREDGAAGTSFYVKEVASAGAANWNAVPSLAAANTWALKQIFSGEIEIDGAFNHDGTTFGVYGATPVTKPTVTGARGGNAALASLLSALASQGLITDSTTA